MGEKRRKIVIKTGTGIFGQKSINHTLCSGSGPVLTKYAIERTQRSVSIKQEGPGHIQQESHTQNGPNLEEQLIMK
jgi:hypothetical protein